MIAVRISFILAGCLVATQTQSRAAENVMLTDVPDYAWYAGCFGTAGGNMMGFWDRNGLPDLYTGPTGGGVAPLTTTGSNAGIRSLWASSAGMDGRPLSKLGHMDNYWTEYESTAPDPYVLTGRSEHDPECLGDFIGASQKNWKNINGEHDGNIDAFAFVIWDPNGAKRVNHDPLPQDGLAVRDIPSGLRAWTLSRGYHADVFSQWTDFNPEVMPGAGFTFEDLKAEIDAGFPVMLYLQNWNEKSRELPGMPRANPNVHGMLAFGYYVADSGAQYVRYKTSWGGSGDHSMKLWSAGPWEANLPVRGVIGFRPAPKIVSVTHESGALRVRWHGPSATFRDIIAQTDTKLHRYVVERATALDPDEFVAVSEPTTDLEATIPIPDSPVGFFRVRLLPPSE